MGELLPRRVGPPEPATHSQSLKECIGEDLLANGVDAAGGNESIYFVHLPSAATGGRVTRGFPDGLALLLATFKLAARASVLLG